MRFSNKVVRATSKASDQPVHTRRLIRAFASVYKIHSVWSSIHDGVYNKQ